MSEPPTASALSDEPPQDAAGDRTAQRLAMLRELAEIGMRLARGVERRAEEPEAARSDVGLVFSRIARAVRQTLALEARLEAELQVRAREEEGAAHDLRVRQAYAPISQRSHLVRRAVGQAIEADADADDEDEDRREQLFDALDEQLDDREDDADYLDRPIGELVALICKELGVRADLSLWEDEAWAREEAAARPEPPPDPSREPETGREAPGDAPPTAHLAPTGAPSWLSG